MSLRRLYCVQSLRFVHSLIISAKKHINGVSLSLYVGERFNNVNIVLRFPSQIVEKIFLY